MVDVIIVICNAENQEERTWLALPCSLSRAASSPPNSLWSSRTLPACSFTASQNPRPALTTFALPWMWPLFQTVVRDTQFTALPH